MESMSDLIEFMKTNNLDSLTTNGVRDEYVISVDISKIEEVIEEEDYE